jgi:metallophosphoesterase superfamily enzyme
MVTAEYYKELQESMAKRSVESLVEEFNQQVGRRAWTSIRGVHDSILIDTLIAKGVDVSAIYDGVIISFNKKVKLNDAKNKVTFA